MWNTHTICLTLAVAVVVSSFAAHAQTISIGAPAFQGEAAPAVTSPRSLMQRYVPVGAPVRQANAPLQLIIDDSQMSQPVSAPLAISERAISDEVGAQPAINALGPGRFALTVSRVSKPAR